MENIPVAIPKEKMACISAYIVGDGLVEELCILRVILRL
jgi:hypothetical protein